MKEGMDAHEEEAREESGADPGCVVVVVAVVVARVFEDGCDAFWEDDGQGSADEDADRELADAAEGARRQVDDEWGEGGEEGRDRHAGGEGEQASEAHGRARLLRVKLADWRGAGEGPRATTTS